jgi:hypothetical protein
MDLCAARLQPNLQLTTAHTTRVTLPRLSGRHPGTPFATPTAAQLTTAGPGVRPTDPGGPDRVGLGQVTTGALCLEPNLLNQE